MNVPKLAEGAVNLIQDYITANLPAALDTVSTQYKDGINLENPREYLIFKKALNLQNPSVYLIADNYDFKVTENKSNYVNAVARFPISVVVEDVNEDRLTRKAYRYQAALYSVLNLANIGSTDGSLMLKVVVYNNVFSDQWMRKESTGDGGNFLKEVVLQCEVNHWESF